MEKAKKNVHVPDRQEPRSQRLVGEQRRVVLGADGDPPARLEPLAVSRDEVALGLIRWVHGVRVRGRVDHRVRLFVVHETGSRLRGLGDRDGPEVDPGFLVDRRLQCLPLGEQRRVGAQRGQVEALVAGDAGHPVAVALDIALRHGLEPLVRPDRYPHRCRVGDQHRDGAVLEDRDDGIRRSVRDGATLCACRATIAAFLLSRWPVP